jgi:hypothetical protein
MPDGTRPNRPGYDEDFHAWTQYQAEVPRAMPCADNRFGREHVAEEIEDLGRSYRDAARSHVKRIIEHLLKLTYSPAADPRRGWTHSVTETRDELEEKLSTLLRSDLETTLPRLYSDARRRAQVGLEEYGEAEARGIIPQECPCTLEPIPEDDWYPEPSPREEP